MSVFIFTFTQGLNVATGNLCASATASIDGDHNCTNIYPMQLCAEGNARL